MTPHSSVRGEVDLVDDDGSREVVGFGDHEESVEARTSIMERRVPDGRGTRPVAANVDQVVVVTAARDPEPILQLIDRLLVVAEANELPAAVVVNKIDLASDDSVRSHLAAAGYPVISTAATAKEIANFRIRLDCMWISSIGQARSSGSGGNSTRTSTPRTCEMNGR